MDGTKIEANANKYSFVWGNAVDTFNKKMDAQLRAYVKATMEIAKAEDEAHGDKDLLTRKTKYEQAKEILARSSHDLKQGVRVI